MVFEVAIRGRDDTDVHVNVRRRPEPAKRPVFEDPQQLGLERRRHFANLVQEDRPLVGDFEQTALLLSGVGERPALVTEELGLEQRLGIAEQVMFMNARAARRLL